MVKFLLLEQKFDMNNLLLQAVHKSLTALKADLKPKRSVERLGFSSTFTFSTDTLAIGSPFRG